MVDLGGYVIILVETHDKKVKLYGSPAEKADLEVADEILEVNGESLENSNHTDVIAHIHNCIKSRTICLRVKRRTSNKLAKELAENSHVQDAFVIAVEQQAKERLERLSALRRIKPVDMTKLSQQLCDTSPDNDENSQIYSAPVAELGSTTNLTQCENQENVRNGADKGSKLSTTSKKNQPCVTRPTKPNRQSEENDASGYVTDEELELRQTLEPSEVTTSTKQQQQTHKPPLSTLPNSIQVSMEASKAVVTDAESSIVSATSPSKEVLIGGDNNPSRRSSRGSIKNYRTPSAASTPGTNGRNNNNSLIIKNSIQESLEDNKDLKDEDVLGNIHKSLSQTLSLKSILDVDEMMRRLDRLQSQCDENNTTKLLPLQSIIQLLENRQFHKLLDIHNIIQTVQCFQCPPTPLCCDAKVLVRECSDALQSSTLPEAAELLDLLNHIEVEGLLFAHDKLAVRQAALPWAQCVAEMWTKERPPSSSSSAPTTSVANAAAVIATTSSANNSTTALQSKTSVVTSSNSASSVQPQQIATTIPTTTSMTSVMASNSHSTATASEVTRVVKILKQNEPLGATVRNEGERVVIGRVVKGGAAERSGQLHPGDEVLEVNGLRLKGKSVHDICDRLCQMTGTLTFVIVPKEAAKRAKSIESNESSRPEQVYHYRAHFSYHPDDDLYIPCHELGISFQRGDILHVINRDDPHWWQAYRDGEWTQTLAGLVPSLSLQQHRMALQKQKRDQDLKEQREAEKNSPARKKSSAASSLLCARKSNKRKRHNSPFKKAASERFDILPYEEMALYYPQANQKRPLILVGPPSIGRHELRLRLLEDTSRFAAAVPHTSRMKGEGEIDGQDYHFVNRPQFEEYISAKRFIEHGEYDKQYYGTSLDAVRTVINSGKICVLNLQPVSLQILHDSDLKPYVVFLTPPTLQTYRQQRAKYGEPCREDEYRDSVAIAQDMEENYGHYFDSVIPFDDVDYVFQQLMYEINLLEREPQWVPAKWVRAQQ